MAQRTVKSIVTAAALSALAIPAHAVTQTVEFDFRTTTPSAEAPSYSFSSGGLGLTVRAGQAASGVLAIGMDNARVTEAARGLGALRDGESAGPIGAVNGRGGRDGLVFDFDKSVSVQNIWFGRIGSDWAGEEFRFFAPNAGGDLAAASGAIGIPNGGTFVNYMLSGAAAAWSGDVFGLAATDFNDSWRVAGMKVSFESITANPIPAPAGLLLGALGLLAYSLRARKPA